MENLYLGKSIFFKEKILEKIWREVKINNFGNLKKESGNDNVAYKKPH